MNVISFNLMGWWFVKKKQKIDNEAAPKVGSKNCLCFQIGADLNSQI